MECKIISLTHKKYPWSGIRLSSQLLDYVLTNQAYKKLDKHTKNK